MWKKENAYKDFMQDLEKGRTYKRLTAEEQTFLKNQLEWLWELGWVYGTYGQRYRTLKCCVKFFLWGAGHRPGNRWREDIA